MTVHHLNQLFRGITEIEGLHSEGRITIFTNTTLGSMWFDADTSTTVWTNWWIISRSTTASKCLHRHVFVFRERKIVSSNSIIVAANDILTRCLAISCVEERRVQLKNFAVVLNCLLVFFFFLCKFGSHEDSHCILIVCIDLFCHKSLNFGMFSSRQKSVEYWPSSACSWLLALTDVVITFIDSSYCTAKGRTSSFTNRIVVIWVERFCVVYVACIG